MPTIWLPPGDFSGVISGFYAGQRNRSRWQAVGSRGWISRYISCWRFTTPALAKGEFSARPEAVVAGGIATGTWLRTVSYPRAAVAGGQAVKAYQQVDYQRALAGLERASRLAPDVSVYYTHQSSVYAAFLKNPGGRQELERRSMIDVAPYETCLVHKTYLVNRASAEQRPFYWRSRLAMANSALSLGWNEEAISLYTEVVATVPASWPLRNRLAEAYVDIGQLERAIQVLGQSLAISGDSANSDRVRELLEAANQKLKERDTRDSGS